MGVVTGIVLYAIIWFMTLFISLQIRVTSQNEAGGRIAGTPGSAPSDPQLKKRVIWTSLAAGVIWAIVASIIVFQWITIDDIDLFTRFGMGSSARP